VHLIHAELFDQIALDGFRVAAGELGENVTTRGVDLLALPEGTVLRLGDRAAVRLTGLRSPCVQIDRARPGLMRRLLQRDDEGRPRPIVGVMSVVVAGGPVRPGDDIRVVPPDVGAPPLRPI
jgi:MOSC domain-containing protein YiiM